MATPLKIILGLWALFLVVLVLVVVRAVRRRRRGQDAIQARGWTRLPEAGGLVAGWTGWPFEGTRRPGHAKDAVVGELQGCRFMAFTWSWVDPSLNPDIDDDIHRRSVVALATEQSYPRLAVQPGWWGSRLGRGRPEIPDVELGHRRWEVTGDRDFADALLTPEVLAVLERVGESVSVQPGWVVRVLGQWEFYAGEDRMVEELQKLAAPFRAVPAATWAAYGGAPRFVSVLGHLPQGG